MKLIVGLGNPGPEYVGTRHNVGFDVLDRLARRSAPGGAVARSKFHGATIETDVNGERVMLLKPLTYMNRSGFAIGEAASFYKLSPADVMVIVDDVALPCGQIRLRADGSAGGHNGLADVERALGTAAYPRLRIGIDQPGQVRQKDYVLGRFRPDQLTLLEPALDEAVNAALCWVHQGITEAMNRFNRRNTA